MGKDSAISWCHHTFNLWWGCWKISAGCQHCYAATMDKRTGGDHWQRAGERKFMSAAYWRGPLAWNKAAAKAGERHRVFCGSMMDVGETHPNPVIAAQQDAARDDLWNLILATPNLDWLLLTKRPADLRSHLPWGARGAFAEPFKNVWLGVSVENQAAADDRIPELLATPAAVRFLSCEPLLSGISLEKFLSSRPGIHWIIAGCESGPGARRCEVDWLRSLRDQCSAAGVPFFLKQSVDVAAPDGRGGFSSPISFGAGSHAKGKIIELPYLDGKQWVEFPTSAPSDRQSSTSPSGG